MRRTKSRRISAATECAPPITWEVTMAERIPANFRRVITAAAGGNVIEWYDFYIFGSLATILSVKFFEKSHPIAAPVSYTHLRAHETRHDLVCRLLLEKKK